MEHPFGRRLEKQLKEVIDKTITDLGEGHATSFEDYKLLVGTVSGLRTALAIAAEVEEQMNKGQ